MLKPSKIKEKKALHTRIFNLKIQITKKISILK